jgi:folylpolyglutamate synthase/dihydropteroate synthase
MLPTIAVLQTFLSGWTRCVSHCSPYGELSCGLVGSYQAANAAVAITAVEILRRKGWQIGDDVLKNGLATTDGRRDSKFFGKVRFYCGRRA